MEELKECKGFKELSSAGVQEFEEFKPAPAWMAVAVTVNRDAFGPLPAAPVIGVTEGPRNSLNYSNSSNSLNYSNSCTPALLNSSNYSSIRASRALTSRLTSLAESGLSTGKRIVPLDIDNPFSSSLSASTREAVGKRLQ
jgi:hypothetical protein